MLLVISATDISFSSIHKSKLGYMLGAEKNTSVDHTEGFIE